MPAAPRLSPFSYLLHLVLLRGGPTSPKSWSYRIARFFVFLSYTYLSLLVILLFLENRFLYHPATAAEYWEPPPAAIAVDDVEMTTVDGTQLHGWWSAPPAWKPDEGAVLFCHGNAGNVSMFGWQMAGWVTERKQAVFAFDYPGFGKSDGTPSEAGCYAAADAAYDYLTQVRHVPARRLLIYGESLGGAVATDLACRHPYRALLLSSTFTSFPDMAQAKYPYFPARWLVRNQFRSVEKIRNCPGPIFMAHGTDDWLIPFAQGQRLFAAANGPKEFFTMTGLGHEPPSPDFYIRCMKFLADVEKEAKRQPAAGN
jgi:pimeloyl-ACP methyl ester carboxylesterase